MDFIELSIISISLLFSSEPVNDALWLNAARACMWRLPDRAEMSWKRRHHGRDSQLWPYRWQDLWCRSIPDGEHSVLPTRRLQDYVTKVTFSFLALNLQHAAFLLRNLGNLEFSEISNAEQHCMLGISKIKCATLAMCEWMVMYIIFECGGSFVLGVGLSTTPLTVLYSASAFWELKSMEAFSQPSIKCVMEAQGLSLGTEYERMKKWHGMKKSF